MSDERLPWGHLGVAFLAGFGLGAWFGSDRTVRRVRHFSAPENRAELERLKQRWLAGRRRLAEPS